MAGSRSRLPVRQFLSMDRREYATDTNGDARDLLDRGRPFAGTAAIALGTVLLAGCSTELDRSRMSIN